MSPKRTPEQQRAQQKHEHEAALEPVDVPTGGTLFKAQRDAIREKWNVSASVRFRKGWERRMLRVAGEGQNLYAALQDAKAAINENILKGLEAEDEEEDGLTSSGHRGANADGSSSAANADGSSSAANADGSSSAQMPAPQFPARMPAPQLPEPSQFSVSVYSIGFKTWEMNCRTDAEVLPRIRQLYPTHNWQIIPIGIPVKGV